MEHTALNGTTTAASKDQEWKTKKGYGPIIVVMCLALLLGLSLYAGGPYDGDNLRRYDESIVDGSATSAVQGGAGCYPGAAGTFNGVGQSVTTWWGKNYPFQTCYQFNSLKTYCWTNSYYYYDERYGKTFDYSNYFQCVPNGGGDAWHHIFLDVPFPCGSPCQGQHMDTHSVVRSA